MSSQAIMTPSKTIWIQSARYDLAFVMGGALLTLMVPLAVSSSPALLPMILWGWFVFFEGSHFWATFSRTYIDADFRRQNPGFLSWSLVFFLFPVLMVVLDRQNPAVRYMDLYGFFIFIWSLYHNARQHFGFVSIYSKKSGSPNSIQDRYKFAIYAAVAAPQLFFLLNHKFQSAFQSFPKPGLMDPSLGFFLSEAPKIASCITLVYLISTLIKDRKLNRSSSNVPFLYCLVCLIFYSTMFYVIAPMEPFFSSAANGAQTYMVIAVMNSLFHNIQYHAIVWHYSKKRYGEGSVRSDDFGLAKWVGGNFRRYSMVALFFGAVFGAIVWNLGDWPSVFGDYTQTGASTWAYCLFFGIIGHHFYLDQKIWRPSHQSDLNAYLGLKSGPITK
jgi:hypothetical protein